MSDYKNIRIEDYTYDLPDERIARYPKKNRDESKLLHFKHKNIVTTVFKSLPDLLSANDLLIFNNAKVIQARLAFKKETGASIEIFCLEPHQPADYNLAFQAKEKAQWKCLVGNLKKWKSGRLTKMIEIDGKAYNLAARQIAKAGNAVIIGFEWQMVDNQGDIDVLTFGEILERTGSTPLPPYLNRKAEKEDKDSYQTVYAKQKGSVAAPTAGLHFTDSVFGELEKKGIRKQELTLHVSAGTFRPVQSETIEGHDMHEEHFEVSIDMLEAVLNQTDRVISVGTTSVRTLESLYWMGVKLINKEPDPFLISQWEVYEKNGNVDLQMSFGAIKSYMEENQQTILPASTRIIIVPGYHFKVINGLVTNFHQPQSTLLLLIAAVIGNKWKEVYEYALANDYRFLSYGDSSLLTLEH